jgi:hypothetical protein
VGGDCGDWMERAQHNWRNISTIYIIYIYIY